MVLSTLHVREAVSAPVRLLDMEVPRFMVATSLQAVIAQRLVRLVCDGCAAPYAPSPQELRFLEALRPGAAAGLRRGRGCGHCNGSGYRGRGGVYEMLEMTPRLVEALAKEDITAFMHAAQEEMAGETFVRHAAVLAAAGRTTASEVMRIGHSED
jgi:MSHA biogenesis protein MshE